MSDSVVYASKMPILALRGLAVFPEQTIHFDVGRTKSGLALEAAMKGDQTLMLVPQKDVLVDDPKLADLYPIGSIVKVKQVLKSPDDNLRVLVTGCSRARITEMQQTEPYLAGYVESVCEAPVSDSVRSHALRREAVALYNSYLELSEYPAQLIQLKMMTSSDTGFIADSIAQNSGMDYTDKAKLLCMLNSVKRIETVITLLRNEVEMLQLEAEIQEKTKAHLDQNQKDYYLREQIKTIREELGENDEETEYSADVDRILKLKLPEEYEKKLLRDAEKLKKQSYGSSEAAVLRNYLDTVLELPWHTKTKDKMDVNAVKKQLDKDHFGMQKVKERILESIAVRQMVPQMPPQILCLVGPPGVGKTSIAYSIAKSLNRKLVRISLGGIHDEADIRGHRKTYVGAMPGRIMSAMKQAGTCNPILLLDEIDKMGSDYRGDPGSALLEVLDAEQNHTYRDHYIEIPYDLSDVMFITTANSLETVSRPLLDRMEVIQLDSYTDEEKLMISKNHLIPKQLGKHGLKKSQLRISDDCIREIITCYTRESGVRNLERCFSDICRKLDVKILSDSESKRYSVNSINLEEYLGVRRYLPEYTASVNQIGLVTGLAWTSVGGETLEVEVCVMDGSGKLELTGNLGDVMKESAHAAYSYIRANSEELGIKTDFYKTKDIHIHFPEGAVPKDGPSAGVTVCTAMVSALTGQAVRCNIAMTGEISLRGRVMRIGGLKEKTMAALRHGIHTVIIPSDNERDLEEIDQTVRNKLNFIVAEHVRTVLKAALVPKDVLDASIMASIPDAAVVKSRVSEIRQ